LSVLLVTKARVDEGSTKWAQGGIAAALGDGDSPDDHLRDTLEAGAGLCDVDAVRVLVTEGPAAVRKLIERGAIFDREDSGEISLTREGGHHRNRIIHAGGDATGAATVKNAIEFYTTAADGSGNMIYSHSHDPGNAATSVRVLYTTASGTSVGYLKIWAAE
jgi:aspartate oxidase